jgi:hypothetical protein
MGGLRRHPGPSSTEPKTILTYSCSTTPKAALSHPVNSLKDVSTRQLRQDFISRINRAAMRGTSWSPPYFTGSCSGAPLSILKDYTTDQKQPHQAKPPPYPEGQGFRPTSPMNRVAAALTRGLSRSRIGREPRERGQLLRASQPVGRSRSDESDRSPISRRATMDRSR